MEILSDKHNILGGEGPIWNPFDKKLYQVNNSMESHEILEIDLITKEVITHKFDYSVVAAIAFSKKGEMLVSCWDGVYILKNDNTRKPLYNTEKYEIKYGNDAKVGPDGRLYVGNLSGKRMGINDKLDGKLYSIDINGDVKVVLDGLILSNGFDWSMDEKHLYHTDSDTNIIKEYDFDKTTGEVCFTGRQVKVDGVDGITIDQNDCLYVACGGKWHIAVVDTNDMQIKKYINVPAANPPSCCFAGDNMSKLVVVSAKSHLSPSEDKNAGYTFIYDAQAKGRKPYLFG